MYLNNEITELLLFSLDNSDDISKYSSTVKVAVLEKVETLLESDFVAEIADTIMEYPEEELTGVAVSVDTNGDDVITITLSDYDEKADGLEIELTEDEITQETLEEICLDYLQNHYFPAYDILFERDEDDDLFDDDDDEEDDIFDFEDDESPLLDMISYYSDHDEF